MTKQKLFLSTLILAIFLTACSNPGQTPANQNSPTAQPGQEIKAQNNNEAIIGNPNVVKAEGAVGIVTPPNQQAISPQANAANPAMVNLANAPKIELPAKKVDFGKVGEDKKIVREFVVKNVGKSVLNISSVAPSCGCTTVDFPKAIKPGKSGKITLKVDTGKGAGPRTKTVTINSDDPQDKAVTFEFSFTVQ